MEIALLKDNAQKAAEVLRKILEFGPKTPEFTGHLQAAFEEVLAAKKMVTDHFGVAAGGVVITVEWAEVEKHCPECVELCGKLEGVAGVGAGENKGPFKDFVMQLITNPAFLTFIMSLFKPAG